MEFWVILKIEFEKGGENLGEGGRGGEHRLEDLKEFRSPPMKQEGGGERTPVQRKRGYIEEKGGCAEKRVDLIALGGSCCAEEETFI